MPSSLSSTLLINNTVLLKDLQLNTNQSGGRKDGKGKDVEKQKLSKRFEDLGIPVGLLSNSRKNKPRELPPNTEGDVTHAIVTDKLMNFFIKRVLP
jgi:hypothetical protein